jgi:hypothetical protein
LKRTATISATPIRCEMKLCTIRFSTKVSHDKTFLSSHTSFRGPFFPPYSLCSTGDVSCFQWRNSVGNQKMKNIRIYRVPSRKKPKVHRIV